jgi:hypothetical protein
MRRTKIATKRTFTGTIIPKMKMPIRLCKIWNSGMHCGAVTRAMRVMRVVVREGCGITVKSQCYQSFRLREEHER